MSVTHDEPHTQRGTCRSCDARLLWVITTNGRRMPLDLDPVVWVAERMPSEQAAALGLAIDVVVTTDGRTVRGAVVEPNTPNATPGRHSHFATCPGAGQHRRVRHG